ncbi:Uncharacterized protein dnl_37500 [Desulfonema limicola]|uniref:Uncharacterized protein n=1 Tax=Desulfonema limicola TaxID=45656 RepID=A0A975B9V1_9BACT|nr:hypothetical protein [Desulfonema limicola]QTA81415.1 Uncharacterized protein dnl_37500 [Desulfonema limicola]
MNMNQTDQEMIKDITRMGMKTGILLRGVMLQKVDEETLKWGLKELCPGDLMSRYFPFLVTRPDYVNLLNILHLVYSLEGQLDFQIKEYGFDSLKDDLHEINFSLQQIGEQFDLQELAQAV